jgi:hypothetical protein
MCSATSHLIFKAGNSFVTALANDYPKGGDGSHLAERLFGFERTSYAIYIARLLAVAPLDLWLHTNAFGLCLKGVA